MIKALGAIAAAAFASSTAPAMAWPSVSPEVNTPSSIELVAYGCGGGFHPNRAGYCVPNVRYAPPPRPIYVPPRPIYAPPRPIYAPPRPTYYYNPGYYPPRPTYYHPPQPYYQPQPSYQPAPYGYDYNTW